MPVSEFWGLLIGMIAIALTMVASVIAMMFWARTESNELRKEAKEDRKDFLQLIRSIEFKINSIESKLK